MATKATAKNRRVQVYFNKSYEDVYKAINDMHKKYGVSASVIALFAIDAGLGVVEKHFQDMKSGGIRESHTLKK